MPQFRFRVLTPDGRVRSGRFTGNSQEEVRQQIESSGLKILELALLEEAAASPPPLYQHRTRLPSISGYWLAAGLAVWGLSWGILSGKADPVSARPKKTRDAVAMAEQRFQAEFHAQWSASTAVDGAQLVYRFPEIPFQLERSWPQKEARIEFLAARQPSYCIVELRNSRGILGTARVEPIRANNEFTLTASPVANH